MYRTQYSQYPPINQNRPGIAYSSTIPGSRTPNVVGAGPHQATGPVAFLRQAQNGPYGFSSSLSQQQTPSSSLQQPQLLSSTAHAQAANGQQLLSAQTSRPLTSTKSDGQQLDLNEFPALGAAGSSTTTPAAGGLSAGSGTAVNATNSSASYAAQAQHHSSSSSAQGPAQPLGGNGVARDFTNPDDFPALGGPSTAHDAQLQPPGLNGYQAQQQPISILRNPMLQGDDKRQVFGLKQNPSTPSSWNLHTSPAVYGSATNGHSQQQTLANPQHLAQQQQQQQQQLAQAASGAQQPDDALSLAPTSTTNQQQLVQPHTPADQVLHSAADRWGLLALVRALRQQTDDVLSSGQDLGLLGMELDNPGSLYPKFATPWADYMSVEPTTEPNYHLPSCYNVAPPPPNPKKAAQFSDETLFFTFYSMPRDLFQDIAAQELYNRKWRYHKTQRLWIHMDGVNPESLRPGAEPALFTIWDVEAWERQPRMLRFDVRELENRDQANAASNPSAQSNAAERPTQGGPIGIQQAAAAQRQQFAQPMQQHLRV
ncbi:SubName: Full=Related to CDC36-transcription factor {ECO:0000313/EMBL:CCA70388.1} [Serendipita indica DSM 11827]|nr:SubName: Full=Related to CDC36-transcription factor {ECO:0000313/EMBL:CCA70388.1} [Serendipita indica DSM 11827]